MIHNHKGAALLLTVFIAGQTHALKDVRPKHLGIQIEPLGPASASTTVAGRVNASVSISEPEHEKLLLDITGFGHEDMLARNQSNLTGVTINGKGDTHVFITTGIFSIFTTFFVILAFNTCRLSCPAVYTRAPHHSSGFGATTLDWMVKVWNSTPEEEVRAAGLDGWAFLEFYRMNLRILSQMGTAIVFILCPLQVYLTWDGSVEDFLSRLDVAHLPNHEWILWLHAALVWLVVAVFCHNLLRSHEEFLDRRFEWLKGIPWPRAVTVMVENIPAEYRSDVALNNYFTAFFREEAVQSAYVVRRTEKLRQEVEQLETARYNMALARQAWEQSGRPSLPSSSNNVAAHLNKPKVVIDLERAIHVRQMIAAKVAAEQAKVEAAVAQKDLSVCSSSGFVTFTAELQQRLARNEHYRRNVTELTLNMPPDPHDVIYANLAESQIDSATRKWFAWMCLVGIFVFWSPVVIFISSWTTLDVVRKQVPLLDRWCYDMKGLQMTLEGILASAALKMFLAFLPSLLLLIIGQFFTLKAGAWAQFHLERWYFSFLFIFVLLVTTIGRGIIISAEHLVKYPTQFFALLSSTLPSASHFYLNYMVMGWVTMAWELTRSTVLLKFVFYKLFYSFGDVSAKQFAEPEDQASSGLGSRMALAVLMSSIFMVFSTCSPLILLCAIPYFALGRVTYGYLLVHVEVKKPDLGGEFWAESVRQLFVVLAMYVLMMSGVLAAHAGAHDGPAADAPGSGPALAALAALLGLFWSWQRINVFAWESLPLEEVVNATEKSQEEHDGKYVQPECDHDLLSEEWKEDSELGVQYST